MRKNRYRDMQMMVDGHESCFCKEPAKEEKKIEFVKELTWWQKAWNWFLDWRA